MGWFKKTLDLQQIRPDVGTQPQKQFGVTGEQSWQREEDRIYMPDELLWVNVLKPERKVRLSLCEDYTTQVTLCLCLQSCLLQLQPQATSLLFCDLSKIQCVGFKRFISRNTLSILVFSGVFNHLKNRCSGHLRMSLSLCTHRESESLFSACRVSTVSAALMIHLIHTDCDASFPST